MSFQELGICEALLGALKKERIIKPTPVQASTIPQLLAHHRDVTVEACTGSGKTLAYLLPTLEILNKTRGDRVNKPLSIGALILAPTRELALQIHKVSAPYCACLNLGSQLLTSGHHQVVAEESKWDLVIGTPGRVDEFLDKNKDEIKLLEILILDEADTLLSLGFQLTIHSILKKLPKQRRTGLFSATQTKQVEALVRAGMRNPATISVRVHSAKEDDAFQKTPTQLNNFFQVVEANEKLARLCNFLMSHQGKCIVFFATCAMVDYFGDCILRRILPTTAASLFTLHGKMTPKRRKLTFDAFCKRDEGGILCCTDLVARGIDLPDVEWIIQFDAPKDPDFFVHRCGRTARAGRSGSALLFLLPNEYAFVEYLAQQLVPLSKMDMCKETEDDKFTVSNIAAEAKRFSLEDRDVLEKGTQAFISYIAYYVEHRLSYLFQLEELDFAKLLQAFYLLQLPKLKEFRNPKIKPQLLSFEEVPSEVIRNIAFKLPAREEKRQRLLVLGKAVNEERKKKKKGIERRQKQAEELPNKRKRKGKNEQIFDEWEELKKEDQMHRRFKKKKLTSEEYDKFLEDE